MFSGHNHNTISDIRDSDNSNLRVAVIVLTMIILWLNNYEVFKK